MITIIFIDTKEEQAMISTVSMNPHIVPNALSIIQMPAPDITARTPMQAPDIGDNQAVISIASMNPHTTNNAPSTSMQVLNKVLNDLRMQMRM